MFFDVKHIFMLSLTLRQYGYVVAAADAGSLTKAAEMVNVSQPSLSVAISRVEDHLGQRIFVRRNGAATTLTPFGQGFVSKARQLLTEARALETPRGRGVDTPFTLACFEDIAPWYLAAATATARLRAELPTTPFAMREGRFAALATDLLRGRADIALSYDLGFDARFERAPFATVAPSVFVAPDHPLAAKKTVALADLADAHLVLFSEDLSFGHMMALFKRVGLRVTVAHRAASLEMMRSLAAHGAGIGFSYSAPPLGTSYDGATLVTVPVSSPEATADIALIWSTLNDRHHHFARIVEILRSP